MCEAITWIDEDGTVHVIGEDCGNDTVALSALEKAIKDHDYSACVREAKMLNNADPYGFCQAMICGTPYTPPNFDPGRIVIKTEKTCEGTTLVKTIYYNDGSQYQERSFNSTECGGGECPPGYTMWFGVCVKDAGPVDPPDVPCPYGKVIEKPLLGNCPEGYVLEKSWGRDLCYCEAEYDPYSWWNRLMEWLSANLTKVAIIVAAIAAVVIALGIRKPPSATTEGEFESMNLGEF